MDALKCMMIFTQIIDVSIDTRQWRIKDILNIFQKGSIFGLDDYLFWECLFTQINVVQKANSLWMAKSEMTGIHFLFLPKNHKLFSKFLTQTFVV